MGQAVNQMAYTLPVLHVFLSLLHLVDGLPATHQFLAQQRHLVPEHLHVPVVGPGGGGGGGGRAVHKQTLGAGRQVGGTGRQTVLADHQVTGAGCQKVAWRPWRQSIPWGSWKK